MSFGVQDVHAGIAADLVMVGEFAIRLFYFGGHRFLTGEIDFEQHKVFVGKAGELGLAEYFVLQANAPWAPVGAGEVYKDQFVLAARLVLGGFKVCKPVRRRRGCKCDCGRDDQCHEGLHKLVRVLAN